MSSSSSSRFIADDVLGESWVEVADLAPSSPPGCDVKGISGGVAVPDDYLRLLREAQRESNQSSAIVSLASTRKNSPHGSPKSPPNSPNTEPAGEGEELKGIYINYYSKENGASDNTPIENNTDWVWDWSSRPDQEPPKEWKFVHPNEDGVVRKPYGYSIRFVKVGGTSVFSRQILYTMVITNLLSLLLGTGIGFWLSRRSILYAALD